MQERALDKPKDRFHLLCSFFVEKKDCYRCHITICFYNNHWLKKFNIFQLFINIHVKHFLMSCTTDQYRFYITPQTTHGSRIYYELCITALHKHKNTHVHTAVIFSETSTEHAFDLAVFFTVPPLFSCHYHPMRSAAMCVCICVETSVSFWHTPSRFMPTGKSLWITLG